MTEILYGQRELLVRGIGNAKLVDSDEEGLAKGPDLYLRWHQRTLTRKPLAVLNPPEPPKKFAPIEGYFLLFAKDKVPIAWARWAQANNVTMTLKDFPQPAAMANYLSSGKAPIKFTPDAAEWYTRVVGTSPMRLDSEVRKLILLGRQDVDLDALLNLIGDPSHVRAENILRSLGTARSIALAKEVPVKQSIPLMAYLAKALENRKTGWGLMLSTIRIGADRLQYSYYTGIQMFVHACYQAEHGSNQVAIALELMEAANVVK